MNLERTEQQPKWKPEIQLRKVDTYLEKYREQQKRRPDLSNPQKLLLAFLLDRHGISVCTEVGPALGTITGHEIYQGHFALKTLYKLFCEGFLVKKEESIYGIRWETFYCSQEEVARWKI